MSKFKKYAYILLVAMSIDLMLPSINAMATISSDIRNGNAVSISDYQNDESNINGNSNISPFMDDNSTIVETSTFVDDFTSEDDLSIGNETILENEHIENDLDESNNLNDNSVTQDSNESILEAKNSSVIEGTIENITSPHKLTADFFVKGYFVSTHQINKVEVFIDGNKIGDARYGIERQDIGSKYQYPNSLKSGFEFPARGISNGNHVLKVVATNSEGVKKESTANITVNNSKTSIMGKGNLKKEQMVNFLHRNNLDKPMSYILNFVDLVISEAALEGVNHDVLFSQIMNETNFLKFTGDVKEEQNNFAGIGATGNGNPGESFPSIQIGIRAVVQHLKAYASSEPLKMELVDPRFKYVQRESAVYVEHLGIKENPNYKGWATAKEYGYRLLSMKDNVSNESTSLRYSYLTDFSNSGQAKFGEKITLTAKANNSSGVSYKFEVIESGSNTWKTIGDWSSKNTLEYTPAKTGNHKFKVSIRSIDSTVDDYKTLDLNVTTTKSKVTSLNISGNKMVGSPITMTASADPSDSTLYKLWVCDRSTNTWTVLSDWSTKNKIDYTPKKAGNYTFTVHVKHKSSSSNGEDDYRAVDVNITNPTSKVSSLTVTGNKVAGSKLTMEAKGTPEADTLYKLWVADRQTGKWTVLSDWSTKNKIEYTPSKAGKYTFTVHVKHKNSSNNEEDDYRAVDVNVTNSTSKVSSLTVTGDKIFGSKLTMEAKGTPEADTLYKLWVADRQTGTWTVLSDWSTKNKIEYTPSKPGRYTFTVHVKSKYSNSSVEDDYRAVDVDVIKPTSKVSSLTVTGNKVPGSKLTMEAKGTPEADTLYKLWVADRQTGKWTVLSDWSTKNKIEYTPSKGGRYTFTVHVKHKNSTSNVEDDYRAVDVNITNPTSKVSSLTVTGNKVAGSKLTMEAKGTPEADTLYKLWVADRQTGKWTVLSDWSTKNKIEYTPSKGGRYTFTVHVKHKNSTSNVEDDYRAVDVNITNPTSKVSSLTVTGNKVAGSKLTMEAKGTPESDTLYKLWVADRQTGTWIVLSDWSTKNKIEYTPSKPGRYTFTVHVKSKYSNSSVEDDYRAVDVDVTKPTSKVSSLTVTGNKMVGSKLTMEAKGTPEADTLYKLWVADRQTGKWTVLSDWSTKNKIEYTPSKAGNYTFTVHVKHKTNTGNVEDDYKAVDVKVETGKSSVSSINVEGDMFLGSTLKLKAEANPSDNTLYKLWICDRSTNTWTVLSDWSTVKSINYTPKKTGQYTFTVHVKHKSNTGQVEDDFKSQDFYVTKKNESMAINLDIKGEAKKGSTLTISATAAPEKDTLYKFWVCNRKTGVWTVLSDWSSNKTVNYKIPEDSNYTFAVHVKHKNSANINEDDYLSKDILVKDKITIVIDPGHNHGGDYGSVSTINGKKYEETELNMQVADLLKKELVNRGYNVVMTREVGDKLYDELRPSLQKRVNLANSLKADLFVSIHHNSSVSSAANGVEVYYSDEKPESGTANSNKVSVSKKLSEVMVNNLSKAVGQTNRGSKNDAFYVVKNTLMPSVLVECGFITNPEEISKISQSSVQKIIAQQLANSIDSTFK